ncbi:hypothetical protein WJX72_005184 [[Myrmecia] bisecta]|uniref:Uncharacterized protein n=1 Tax=[Myrmecia] bisecta TaxID=41462 RepID=A0AAW1R6E4_9CHLO
MQLKGALFAVLLLGGAVAIAVAQSDNDLETLPVEAQPTPGPLADDNEQITPEGAGKFRVAGNRPIFLLFNVDGVGVFRNADHPEWLEVIMPRVYEADVNGNKVTGRGNTNVLYQNPNSQTNWTTENVQVGSPSVRAVKASLVYTQRPTFPACPGAASQTPLTNPNPNAKFTLTVHLLQADTNITLNGVTTEVLKGNLKFNLDADHWPFCSAANQLVVDFATYTSEFIPAHNAVESAEDKAAQALALFDEAEAKLGAIPAPDAGTNAAGPGKPTGRKNSTGTPTLAQIRTILGRMPQNSPARDVVYQRVFRHVPANGLGMRTGVAHKYLAIGASNVTQVNVDVPTTAFIDGAATNFTADVTTANGQKYMLQHLVFPSFTNTLSYDPVMTFAATDSNVALDITSALNTAATTPAPPPPPPQSTTPAPTSGASHAAISLFGTAAAIFTAWAVLW